MSEKKPTPTPAAPATAADLPREFYQLADRIGMREATEEAGEVLRLVQSRKYTTRQIARRVAAKTWRKYGRR